MNAKFATTLAIAALTAAAATSSFASDSAYPLAPAGQSSPVAASSNTGGKTRAQVQNELRDAQRMGYNTNFSDSQFLGNEASGKAASSVTRAQVKMETLQARRFDANENLYRN